jgi:hypothetical protein
VVYFIYSWVDRDMDFGLIEGVHVLPFRPTLRRALEDKASTALPGQTPFTRRLRLAAAAAAAAIIHHQVAAF